MKRQTLPLLAIAMLLAASLFAATIDHPTGARTTPPTILSAQPDGLSRGSTTELVIEGYNLAGASAVYFSDSAVTGRVVQVKELPDVPEPIRLGSGGLPATTDLGPLPPRHQVTVEVEVAAGAATGPVEYRLHTPLGITQPLSAVVQPYWGEMADREPNNTVQQAVDTPLPAIFAGVLSTPGDEDLYRFRVEANEELVFLDGGAWVNSSLRPIVSILKEDYSVVREVTPQESALPGGSQIAFAHRFTDGGVYYLRIRDFEQGGGKNHKYRILTGQFPVVTSVSPAALPLGKPAKVRIEGLGFEAREVSVTASLTAAAEGFEFRPEIGSQVSFNRLNLPVTRDPMVAAAGSNTKLSAAQRVAVPSAIHGRIPEADRGMPGAHYFAFQAKKGRKLIVDVAAQRYGSALDSHIDVLDGKGNPIEQSTVRAVAQAFTTLNERNSSTTGMRIDKWDDFEVGDFLMIGREIVQVSLLPRGPDEDVRFESFPPTRPGSRSMGDAARVAQFGTSPEAHAVDEPIYKVEIHPPGSQFSSNGLPLVRLYAANDDGGPGYGKDSRIEFVPPADGEYFVRIRDMQGQGGSQYPYLLSIREPAPDFSLMADPSAPNVPRGSRVPVMVTAARQDGFNGTIRVKLTGLPSGLTAEEGVIPPGSVSTTLTVAASADADVSKAVPFQVRGVAEIAGKPVERTADPRNSLQMIALVPRADVEMTAHTREVVVEAGGQAEVSVSIRRNNGFAGRVPVEVYGMPAYTDIPAFGLNGVLLNETETKRTFIINSTGRAEPGEYIIYAAGRVETRSPLQNTFAGEAIRLKILPKKD